MMPNTLYAIGILIVMFLGEAQTSKPFKANSILIPAGCFMMGSEDGDPDEKPVKKLCPERFLIQETEVSVAQYELCVKAGKCTIEEKTQQNRYCNWGKPERSNHPMNCIPWNQAKTYCEFVNGALPTEAEWEYAAKGSEGHKYPWGNDIASCQQAILREGNSFGCGKDQTWPVGSMPKDQSPIGVLDMAGNVREWVAGTYYSSYEPLLEEVNKPAPQAGPLRIYRGGSWIDEAASLRLTDRRAVTESYRDGTIGFRCRWDVSIE